MKYRVIGNTEIRVSEIGFGTWGLGGNAYGPVDEKEAISALDLAFEKGVNFYDTSDLYGGGESEILLGKVFKKVRDKVIIATKGGTLPHTGFHMPQDFSEQHLRCALENSLKRLQTDYVDLYQLHSPALDDLENNNVIETLEKFKTEGKIREFGVSVRSPDDGLVAIEKYSFPVLQVNFNMIDQRTLDNGLFELAKRNNVGIIIRTPLVFGYLTSKLDGNETFDNNDHRKNWPSDQLKIWAKAPKIFEKNGLYDNRSAVQVALMFCLSFDMVSTVIPGMINTKQVKENVDSIEKKVLSKSELQLITKVYKSNNFYIGQSNKKNNHIQISDLAQLFGTTISDIKKTIGDSYAENQLEYRKLTNDEEIKLKEEIKSVLETNTLKKSGAHRLEDWNIGWDENKHDFITSNYNIKALMPAYFKINNPIRLNGKYAMPLTNEFIYNFIDLLRTWLFKKYFNKFENIYEFGCGTAHNLLRCAQLFPKKHFYGYDWSESSQSIIQLIKNKYGYDIHGFNYDFFNHDEKIKLMENSAVFTFGALEQTGKLYKNFIEKLIENSPGICINIEGFNEFYDTGIESDVLALKYHLKRNYLNGYINHLNNLEQEGRIKILNLHHVRCSNRFDDAQSFVVWRPV